MKPHTRECDARHGACVGSRTTTSAGTRDGVRDVESARARPHDDDDDDDERDDDDDADDDDEDGVVVIIGGTAGEARGREETLWETWTRANARDAVHERIIRAHVVRRG